MRFNPTALAASKPYVAWRRIRGDSLDDFGGFGAILMTSKNEILNLRLSRAKVYPEREIAIQRFPRLQPPQTCDNQYIVDHIAQKAVEYDGLRYGSLMKNR